MVRELDEGEVFKALPFSQEKWNNLMFKAQIFELLKRTGR
jgi:hypothetical protein